VLTLGLPLVAGMNARELAGVMAHEFGHFTQGLAMRMTYVIRSINGWFARVVYERDTWDELLVEWARGAGGSAAVIALLARFFVWVTRRLLWALMMVGHVISCFMLRQMEYSADSYEIQVAGSETFAGTFKKLVMLDVASSRADAEVNEMYQERRLPDNLPLYIHSVVGRMPQGLVDALQEHLDKGRTGLLDTHPATSRRIERARLADAEGILDVECPAADLFSDFEQLSREVTRISYGWMLESKLDRVKLVPLAAAKSEQEAAEKDLASLKRFLQGLWQVDRPVGLRMDDFKTPTEAKETISRLKHTRGKIEAALPQARALYEKYQQTREERATAARARALLKAEIKIDAKSFGLNSPTIEEATRLEARSRETAEKLQARLAPFDAAQCKRLVMALGLLRVPEVGGRIRDAGALWRECESHVTALARLDAVHERIETIHRCGMCISAVADAVKDGEAKQAAVTLTRDLGRQIHDALAEVRAQLDDDPYPFEHAEEGISIGRWAVDLPPAGDDLDRLMPAAAQAMNRLGHCISG